MVSDILKIIQDLKVVTKYCFYSEMACINIKMWFRDLTQWNKKVAFATALSMVTYTDNYPDYIIVSNNPDDLVLYYKRIEKN